MNGNGGAVGSIDARPYDPRRDLDAYDRLPPRSRAMLRDMPGNVSAPDVARAIAEAGEEAVLAAGEEFAEAIAREHRRVIGEACSR